MRQDADWAEGGRCPLISVVIPVYNRVEYLDQALASLRAQTIASEIEIIVVDDGSTTDVGAALQGAGDDIVLLRQENAGVCAARNRGARAARADIVAFLDDDDLLRPRALESYATVFARHAEVSVVFSDWSWFPADGAPDPRPQAMHTPHRWMLADAPHRRFAGPPPIYILPPGAALSFLVRGKPMFPSALALRRDALRDMGWWDESILHGRECYEFSIRAADHAYCAFIDQDLMALRRGHGDHLTNDKLETWYRESLVLRDALRSYAPSLKRRAKPLIGMHCLKAGRRLIRAGRWRQGLHLGAVGLRQANVSLAGVLWAGLQRKAKRLGRRRG